MSSPRALPEGIAHLVVPEGDERHAADFFGGALHGGDGHGPSDAPFLVLFRHTHVVKTSLRPS